MFLVINDSTDAERFKSKGKNFLIFNFRGNNEPLFRAGLISIFLLECLNTGTNILLPIIFFTFFRKNEDQLTKEKWLGKTLQFIGRRTLDIYLLHYFILPYNLHYMGTWLLQNDNKSFDMLIMLILSFWIIALSLLLSALIRLSPFLGHYLFGVKSKSNSL